ncbi:hypothetical protein ASPTUDRAFT_43674, partial [Aspergillus tubingensis CBS 134.48]
MCARNTPYLRKTKLVASLTNVSPILFLSISTDWIFSKLHFGPAKPNQACLVFSAQSFVPV